MFIERITEGFGMNMRELAVEFQRKNRGKGVVSKVNDYSFEFSTLPDKNGKVETTVYMLSYFLNV